MVEKKAQRSLARVWLRDSLLQPSFRNTDIELSHLPFPLPWSPNYSKYEISSCYDKDFSITVFSYFLVSFSSVYKFFCPILMKNTLALSPKFLILLPIYLDFPPITLFHFRIALYSSYLHLLREHWFPAITIDQTLIPYLWLFCEHWPPTICLHLSYTLFDSLPFSWVLPSYTELSFYTMA